MARTRRLGAKGRNFAVAYLNVLIDDADEEELTAALGRIARASGGPKLVEKVELNAPSFYRTLCRRGNPELKSVAALLKAMGIRLTLQPLGERKPMQHLRARRPPGRRPHETRQASRNVAIPSPTFPR